MRFKKLQEKHRIIIIALLLGICCFLTYYFRVVLGTGIIFTHFFYIPIILASLWWKRKGLVVAIFLALLLTLSHIFLREVGVTANDYLRAGMLIVIGFVVAMLSERIARAGRITREARDYLDSLIRHASVPIIVWDPEFRITRLNHAFERLAGYTADEVLSQELSMLFPEASRDESLGKIERTLKGEYWESVEIPILRKDGNVRIALWNSANIHAEDGTTLLATIAQGIDITERKLAAEEALQESEQKYRRLFKTSQDGILLADADSGEIIDVNPYLLNLLECNLKELQGKVIWEISPFSTMPGMKQGFESLHREGFARFTTCRTLADGATVFMEFVNSIYLVGGRKVLQCNVRDITEREETMEALRESERKYRTLFQSIADGVLIHDDKGKILDANKTTCIRLGRTLAELKGMNIRELVGKEYATLVSKRIRKTTSKRINIFETVFLSKTGKPIPCEVLETITAYKGVPTILSVARDITERKQAEGALRESETKFKTLTDNVNIGIYRNTTGPRGKFIEANLAIVKLFGYKNKEEFLAMKVADLYQNPADRKKFNEKMLSVGFVENEELQLKRKNGTLFIGSVSVVAVKDEKGKVKYYDGVIEDITNRKWTEEALLKSEKRYRQLVELSPDAIVVQCEGKFVFVNSAGVKLFGATNYEQLIGKPIMNFIRPDYQGIVKKRIQSVKEEGKTLLSIEEKIIRLDGEVIDVNVVIAPIIYKNEPAIQVIIRDITERKRMEEQIVRASKLSAMGEMIGGIAHELNNPLTSVLGNAQLLLSSKFDKKTISETLGKIESSAKRCRDIVADLLEFTREKSYRFKPVNINDVIKNVLKMFQEQADISQIKIVTDFQKKLPSVKVSVAHIEQVFLNIMTNAQHAMPKRGTLTITTLVEENNVKIRFQDTGVGIKHKDLEKVFNPFYTKIADSKFKGTGLGLSMAHKIIERHKGIINVESEGKDKGATFIVSLLIAKKQ
ncbi:PAS domain S-box protein [candidate division WOR-3 bacterium]|nr:PAS domain S-box protein [candidate division WOR-3 bacterium]